jgi:hypothetical protein
MEQRIVTAIAAVLIFSAGAAGEFLPLETGNHWSYRSADGGDGFQIAVGLPHLIGGKVYYSLRGFAEVPLLVRRNEEGDLVRLDEEGSANCPWCASQIRTRLTGSPRAAARCRPR